MSDRDRIEYLMNLCMLTPSQFADKTGIQRASISHILSNRNKPSLEVMLKIHYTFPHVDLAWLIAGEGSAPNALSFKENNNETSNIINDDNNVSSQQIESTLFSDLLENENSTYADIDKYSVTKQNVVNVNKDVEKNEKDKLLEHSTEKIPSQLLADRVDNNVNSLKDNSQFTDIELKTDVQKKIKEIKIFYDNGTYETFLPENNQ